MDIRFVSSLNPEDEIRLAQGLLTAIAGVLDQLPIAYTLRIDAGSRTFHHSHTSAEATLLAPGLDAVSGCETSST